MPSTIAESPGESNTISAAVLAASVLPCTAIPTLAFFLYVIKRKKTESGIHQQTFFKAGASLTPSPVMATK
jgi:hypothetical protein